MVAPAGPVLSARDVVKAFGSRTLFDHVSLTIGASEKVGLLGDNGAGKSTLLELLAGLEPRDEGVLEVRRGARIMLLEQRPELDPERTPREIVREGLGAWVEAKAAYDACLARIERGEGGDALMHEQSDLADAVERLGGWARDHVVEDICARLGVIDLDRPVASMSGGEKRRVALARLLVARPDLALLDEPTNHLDTETIAWLEDHLTLEFPGAALIVTHDRYFLDAVCDQTLELDRAKIAEFDGGYTDFLEQKAALLDHEARVEQNRQNLLRREMAWLRRGAKARSTKQKARIARAKKVIAAAPERREERGSFRDVGAKPTRLGKTILDLEGLGIDVGEGAAKKTLVSSLDLRLVAGDRVGIVGQNGAGKTTLLRCILGEVPPARGRIDLGLNTKIAVVDQARANVEEKWSVFDNVAGFEGAERTSGGTVPLGDKIVTLRQYLEHFGFDGSAQRRSLDSLSGGERARVVLAKILKEGANLLLLDEPTNDLDTSTLAALEELIDVWPGCALMISHDRAFLDNVATSILVFEGAGQVTTYPGNYETYLRLRPPPGARSSASADPGRPAPAPEATATKPPPSKKASLNFAEKKELEGMMDAIGVAEQRLSALSAELADPALYAARGAEVSRLRAEHDAAEAEVAKLYARWEDLEARSKAAPK